jgi:photosystem II stability/assembly factor-like uncharacterized protein
MSSSGKKALHVATFSGWYRFEQDGKQLRQTKRDLTYWTLTCMAVDPDNPQKIYVGSEHSGLFYTETAGARWKRAEPNTPKMMLFSALALNGGVMVGTIPSAVYRSKNGGWEELEGVRINSSGANFPPSPELQSRARYLTYDPAAPARLYAGIEVGGVLLSDDGGYTWRPANKGLTDMDIHEILASEQNPGSLSRLRRSLFSQLRPRRPLGEYFTRVTRLRHIRRRRQTWRRLRRLRQGSAEPLDPRRRRHRCNLP